MIPGLMMDAAQVTRSHSLLARPDMAWDARAATAWQTRRARMIQDAMRQVLSRDEEFVRLGGQNVPHPRAGLADYLIAVEDEPRQPDEIFGRLRWGGQFIYLSRDRAAAYTLARDYTERGFELTHGPRYLRTGILRHVPLLGHKLWYFVARKLFLVRPREITERFTYHLRLARPTPAIHAADEYVVMKEVPTLERVVGRLQAKFTDVPQNVIEKRAAKFTEKIFPLFLTREAAMLKILQRDLPPKYRHRVPTLLEVEKDDRGYVRRMWMNWLRNGGPGLSQLDFAHQSADLLHAVHDSAHIMHLDLRLDNFVITEHGVGFVDFGSAVRDGENIQGNPLLSTLFDELMRTSQIQRMLYKMTATGTVTSQLINGAYGRVDKQVDVFYLAVQISQPLHNPDLVGLVNFDPASRPAQALTRLTHDILKPPDPKNPIYRTAADVLAGVRRIEHEMKKT